MTNLKQAILHMTKMNFFLSLKASLPLLFVSLILEKEGQRTEFLKGTSQCSDMKRFYWAQQPLPASKLLARSERKVNAF